MVTPQSETLTINILFSPQNNFTKHQLSSNTAFLKSLDRTADSGESSKKAIGF
jgi:hypothetical protein